MNITFTEYGKQRLQDEMRQEGNDLIASRIRAEVIAEARFTGPVFMVQVGKIEQHEWSKWRWQP